MEELHNYFRVSDGILSSYCDESLAFSLLICDAMQFCRWVPIFQRNLLPPFSGYKSCLEYGLIKLLIRTVQSINSTMQFLYCVIITYVQYKNNHGLTTFDSLNPSSWKVKCACSELHCMQQDGNNT